MRHVVATMYFVHVVLVSSRMINVMTIRPDRRETLRLTASQDSQKFPPTSHPHIHIHTYAIGLHLIVEP